MTTTNLISGSFNDESRCYRDSISIYEPSVKDATNPEPLALVQSNYDNHKYLMPSDFHKMGKRAVSKKKKLNNKEELNSKQKVDGETKNEAKDRSNQLVEAVESFQRPIEIARKYNDLNENSQSVDLESVDEDTADDTSDNLQEDEIDSDDHVQDSQDDEKDQESDDKSDKEDSDGEENNSDANESEEDNDDENKTFDTAITFQSLGLNPWLIEALERMSIRRPTEIQAKCIQPILQGRDVIGVAKTGSGKTAAFALPILHNLALDPYGTYALVLTPTRELAFQLAEQFAALGEGINLRYSVIVGGLDMMRQSLDLQRRPHVIVATPGRLADLIRSSPDVIFLKKLAYLVLDEADRLLNPTFAEDLSEIFQLLPKSRNTLLFTATITDPVLQVLKNPKPGKLPPFQYQVESDSLTVSQLDQRYILLPSYIKDAYLYHILTLPQLSDASFIVFVNKCYTAERLKVMLCNLQHKCVALHSTLSQQDRLNAMSRFKTASTTTLISTDVGSRGLDIPSVQVVINYDLPSDPADYVHRVGRTARAGRGGQAIAFVAERDVNLVHAIEAKVNTKMTSFEIKEDDVIERLKPVSEANRQATMHLHDTKFGEKKKLRLQKYQDKTNDNPKKVKKAKK